MRDAGANCIDAAPRHCGHAARVRDESVHPDPHAAHTQKKPPGPTCIQPCPVTAAAPALCLQKSRRRRPVAMRPENLAGCGCVTEQLRLSTTCQVAPPDLQRKQPPTSPCIARTRDLNTPAGRRGATPAAEEATRHGCSTNYGTYCARYTKQVIRLSRRIKRPLVAGALRVE